MSKQAKKKAIIIIIIVAAALVIGALAVLFLGEKKEDGPITLTVYSELANVSGEQIGWSAEILLEKFNVKLNIVKADAGVYETRMESGNLGDIVVWGGDGENYTKAVKAGYLYDWNEDDLVKEYGPYIYEHMQDAMAKNAEITKKATDGESDAVYGFGHNVAQSSENHESFFYTWDVRWDLYKELGYPEVETLSDMIGLFKDMKKICPTDENGNPTYAVSLWNDWDGDMVMYVKSTATAYYGYDEHGLGLYDPETGKFHDALEEDGPYLECLKFYNDLYQNDLVDPNSMTQKYDAMSEKLQAGGIFFSIFNYSGSAGYNSDEHVKDGKMMCTLAPEQARPIVYGMSTAGGNRVWSIGASTEHPELCMEIINWLCTPEGTMIYNYGPKELCWDYDEEGYAYLTEFGKACAADRKTEMPDGKTFNDGCLQINNTTWSINAINPESNGETYNKEYWKSTNEAIASDILVDWRNHTGCVTTQEYLEKTDYVLAPASNFVLASKDGEFKTTWKSVTDVITTYSWKAIYADSDEEFYEIVDEMIELANDYGYEECVEWSVEQARIRYEQEEAVRK